MSKTRPVRVLFVVLWLLAGFCAGATEDHVQSLELSRGAGHVHLYRQTERPTAVIVFASGDGGWTNWEDEVANWLADAGWWVAGLNCGNYAESPYDGDLLAEDFQRLAKSANAPAGTPLFYGGWSMGAVQAVAAAGNERPPELKGLLLLSCGARGRYGLELKDKLGVAPTGAGTFGLTDFSDRMPGLRIAQFQGGADFISSTAWIQSLPQTAAHTALYEMPRYNHGFDGPDPKFRPSLLRGMGWLQGNDSLAPESPRTALPWGLSPLWPAAAAAMGLALIFLFSKRHAIRLLVTAVLLIGLINLLEALMPKSADVIDWMQQWLPLGVSEDSRLLMLLSGLSLLFLARGLSRRKKVAWWLAVGLLSVSAALHLVRAFDWHHSVAALVLLLPLIRWRKEFVAMSDAPSVRLGLIAAPVVFVVLVIFGTARIHDLGESGKLPEPLDWLSSATAALNATVGLPGNPQGSGGDNSAMEHFLGRMRFTGIACGTVVLLLMLRPVLAKRRHVSSPDEREKAADILARHGNDPSDPFTLLPDKHYFFHPSGEGYVAFANWREMAVALADPVCAPEIRRDLVDQFASYCRSQDWTPLFYGTGSAHRSLYEQAGLITFKVGEDARIPLAEFSLAGGKFQNLRTARNKAKKEGLSFRWYDPSAGVDHGLEAQLHLLSDAWLRSKSGGEMTFDLGAFSLADIRERGCAVVLLPDGKVECFATWIPYARGTGRTLDLMRGRGSPGGIMDFLILESMDHFKEEGVTEISLGNAPLANTETDPQQLSREERRVKLIFDRFDRFYRYKSLFDFKRKYHPAWQGRYLAYPPGTLLARIGLAVAAVHLPGGFRGLIKS
ncbi:phosphatidylglycerol lysyltransferase domain-containing protein [Luteolibacter sp. SL250]|uniref:phosphatidylglycerol lysyltransferase domain-containing protein n=1 Tax=Luteolibacter sp. SL250 TaxID=2995170 RepID=UPI00226E49FE|nr:phosphatidylglycerol lysyltransferase domain-containing protein [Luteolibacter sp. SL250]WAC18595.1 phosphatidylglycerol lysyltransferase domain-containing protein [Luteolibacter sp. SL250]